jgi:meiotic recombination protein SPO11
LHAIAVQRPTTPIYCLADFDPDGLSIFHTYKYGSKLLAHEPDSTVPNIRWIGLASDVVHQPGVVSEQGLLELTARDRQRAKHMLEWNPEVGSAEVSSSHASISSAITTADFVNQSASTAAFRRELQVMLVLGYKAEIELLECQDGGIVQWLSKKMYPSYC